MSLQRGFALPWDDMVAQDRAFRRTTIVVCAAVLIGSVLLETASVQRSAPELEEAEPERYARLLLPTPPPAPDPPEPPPPPPRPVAETPPAPIPEPAPVPAPAPTPAPVPEPVVAEVPEEVPPAPVPPVPVDRVAEAREEAAASGLLPLADALASLRDNAALGTVTETQARIGRVGAAERSERSIVARETAARSAGVDTSMLSRETGGAGLDGRETARVSSTVAANAIAVGGRAGGSGAEGPAARSREEVERVFDRNKGAIYALYDRALRQDPTLQGKLVVQLVIEPDGQVSEVELLSSELGDVELERRLVQRIRLFRFEAREVTRVVMTKPIDFFPA